VPLHIIAEAPTVWITATPAAPLPGYVCVVSKKHVVEPFDLDAEGSTAFWSACMSTARAVRDAVGARKVNYEIHGNSIAHLHMHVYPRYPHDPFEGRPIDGSAENSHRSGEQLQALATAIAAVL
jgi:diadenosine tetraphosphate (Ap4A) HIT family hydrolase